MNGVRGLHVVAVSGLDTGSVCDGLYVLAVCGMGGADVMPGCSGVGDGYVW